jgi:hypothetical protein
MSKGRKETYLFEVQYFPLNIFHVSVPENLNLKHSNYCNLNSFEALKENI